MNRIGMKHSASPLLKMSFETTCTFLIDATAGADSDNLESPSSRLILGRPVSCILFIVHFVYCILNPCKDLHQCAFLLDWSCLVVRSHKVSWLTFFFCALLIPLETSPCILCDVNVHITVSSWLTFLHVQPFQNNAQVKTGTGFFDLRLQLAAAKGS